MLVPLYIEDYDFLSQWQRFGGGGDQPKKSNLHWSSFKPSAILLDISDFFLSPDESTTIESQWLLHNARRNSGSCNSIILMELFAVFAFYSFFLSCRNIPREWYSPIKKCLNRKDESQQRSDIFPYGRPFYGTAWKWSTSRDDAHKRSVRVRVRFRDRISSADQSDTRTDDYNAHTTHTEPFVDGDKYAVQVIASSVFFFDWFFVDAVSLRCGSA